MKNIKDYIKDSVSNLTWNSIQSSTSYFTRDSAIEFIFNFVRSNSSPVRNSIYHSISDYVENVQK